MKQFYSYLTGLSETDAKNETSVDDLLFNSFLSRLSDESLSVCGPFLYSPGGSLQEYLKEVEDSVLLYMVLAKFDLIRAAFIFQKKAGQLVSDGFGLHLSSLIYSTMPVNQIRSSIRIYFVKSSGSMFRIIDDVLKQLGDEQGHPSSFVKKLMIEKGRNLRPQLKSSLPFIFLPLIDDSMNSVVHMNMSQLQHSGTNSSSDNCNLIGIRVMRCGSTQVNGDYVLTSESMEYENSKGNGNNGGICFSNSSGFQLTRMERQLVKNDENVLGSSSTLNVIYDWHILNPVLSCTYYICSTFCLSTLPPLRLE